MTPHECQQSSKKEPKLSDLNLTETYGNDGVLSRLPTGGAHLDIFKEMME